METFLPEVFPPGDPSLDLLGSTDPHRLCEDGVGKDAGSLGVPTPAEKTPSFRFQIAAQLASWYATPSGAVGHCFAAILEAE